MRWGNISVKHTNHGTKVAVIGVLENIHWNSGKKSPVDDESDMNA